MTALLLAAALAVPFLPQTEALCGGAAAAMVFRYWGERHADVQQFAPLVDTRAGGIETGALAGAVRARGWLATEIHGSLEAVRAHLENETPLILLIEDRPSRYHYVVAVGIDDRQVLVHDPTWGPSRPIAIDRLMRAWAATGFWALSVRPGSSTPRRPAAHGGVSELGRCFSPAHAMRAACWRTRWRRPHARARPPAKA